jgi:hypothetical protein
LIYKRLKAILAAEQQAYEQEIFANVKTPLERAAELREKAKQIRINRNNENAQFVAQKLDEKWRYNFSIT